MSKEKYDTNKPGVFIDEKWNMSNKFIKGKIQGITPQCKVCGDKASDNLYLRHIHITNNDNKKYGLFICLNCISRLTILQNIEQVKTGNDLNYDYSKSKAYDYEYITEQIEKKRKEQRKE
ncbi:MAG: hypothetical protein ACM3O3_13045 [Syntrophothermus sp.]